MCAYVRVMNARSKVRSLFVLPLLLMASAVSAGCSAAPADVSESQEGELNAVAGAYQVRLRAKSGEDIVLGFDRAEQPVAGRPECTAVVASPLRIAVSKGTGMTAGRVEAKLDAYLRGRTVAFTRSPEDSRETALRRASSVSYRGEIPSVIIGKRCSGEPFEYFQNLKIVVDGQALIDPIGDKDNFWSRLESASKTGVSAAERHAIALTGKAGSKVDVSFGKLAGDDPASPATCEQTVAAPARIRVRPAAAARAVTVRLEDYMRGPTVAATLAPSSPGLITLAKDADGTFSADVPPFVIDSRCSGTRMTYWQTLELSVDGVIENDPIGDKPRFELDLHEAE
jgi:hypothetical protein